MSRIPSPSHGWRGVSADRTDRCAATRNGTVTNRVSRPSPSCSPRCTAGLVALVLAAVPGCTPLAGGDADLLTMPDPAQDKTRVSSTPFEDDTPPSEPYHPDDIDLSHLPAQACTKVPPLAHGVELDGSPPEAGGMLVAKLAGDRFVGLPLRHTSLDTIVTGTVAETVVTQRFENPLDEPIEAIYTFPLPHDGAVDDYWMRIADRHIRGTIYERDKAKEIYDEAKDAGNSAALLEQERPNIFTQSVANIPAGASISVGMHVVTPLRPSAGRYSLVLPTVVGPRFIPGSPAGSSGTGTARDTATVTDASKITPPILPEGFRTCGDLEITVSIDPGVVVRDLRSRSHRVQVEHDDDGALVTLDQNYALLNRDFTLSWTLAGPSPTATLMADPDDDGDGGWFSLTVQPPVTLADKDAVPREMVFVVDNSGSMRGKPIDTAKATMRQFIDELHPGEAFQVLRFSENASALGTTLMERSDESIAQGLAYVDDMSGTGGTEMRAGIEAALRLPRNRGRARYVVLLTDGYIGNEREIFEVVRNELGDARLFGLGVGAAPNRHLLEGLARMGGGAVHYADQTTSVENGVAKIYKQLRAPALTDLAVQFNGVSVTRQSPARLPDLFMGQPVVIFGRYDGTLSGSAVVTGRAGGSRVELPVRFVQADAQQVDGLESMWARTRIDDLLFAPNAVSDETGLITAGVRHEVTDLSLRHRVLTEFTAFVAVDTKRTVEAEGASVTVVQGVDQVHGMAQGMAHAYAYGGPARPSANANLGLGSVGLIGHGGGAGGGTGSGYGRGSGAGFGGRGSRAPRVRMASVKVRGSMDSVIIRRIVRNHINEVRHCYNEALVRDPTAAGRVVVTFVIDGRGKVTAAAIKESTLADNKVGACVTKAVRRWVFPTSADSETTSMVNYPFVFKTG